MAQVGISILKRRLDVDPSRGDSLRYTNLYQSFLNMEGELKARWLNLLAPRSYEETPEQTSQRTERWKVLRTKPWNKVIVDWERMEFEVLKRNEGSERFSIAAKGWLKYIARVNEILNKYDTLEAKMEREIRCEPGRKRR
jgi:hypothetical protein